VGRGRLVGAGGAPHLAASGGVGQSHTQDPAGHGRSIEDRVRAGRSGRFPVFLGEIASQRTEQDGAAVPARALRFGRARAVFSLVTFQDKHMCLLNFSISEQKCFSGT
jgi:hypothetical protein